MRKLLDDWDRRNIQRVAGIVLKGANAALAENDLTVAARQKVLGGKQPLFDRCGNASFEEHRFAHFSQFAQQIEVLHVARAHLQDVGMLEEQWNLSLIHYLT